MTYIRPGTATQVVSTMAWALVLTGCATASHGAAPQPSAYSSDSATVAALDEQYQAAVKANDPTTMARILADDFVLITGRGTTFTKEALLHEAREATTTYEHQDILTRTVRAWGDAAVVTALLWVKGSRAGKPIDYRLWFSDTYVRSAVGWRYVLGRASLSLSPAPPP